MTSSCRLDHRRCVNIVLKLMFEHSLHSARMMWIEGTILSTSNDYSRVNFDRSIQIGIVSSD